MLKDKTKVFYSTNTKLSYEINEKYYGGAHYIWCCPFFFQPGHAASSTPLHIYTELKRDIETQDEHSAKIRQNISGLLKGADIQLKRGIIKQEDFDEIEYRLTKKWRFTDFKPLIYIIPNKTELQPLIAKVPSCDKAAPDSHEYIIEKIEKDFFDVISFEAQV